jgi:hypothetical protein
MKMGTIVSPWRCDLVRDRATISALTIETAAVDHNSRLQIG